MAAGRSRPRARAGSTRSFSSICPTKEEKPAILQASLTAHGRKRGSEGTFVAVRRQGFRAESSAADTAGWVEFDEPVDRAQEMPGGHVLFERKPIKQSVLTDAALPHHRLTPAPNDE